MEDLIIANKRLKTSHNDHEREYKAETDKLQKKEEELLNRLSYLDDQKLEMARANGNVDAADDDLMEINAGGREIAVKRSTLTQLKGSRLEALFSGRWDKKLLRNGSGRAFLDVNPVCFQAIVDYLSELGISSEDDPPNPPTVDDELNDVLLRQLELFGIHDNVLMMLHSNILRGRDKDAAQLHKWLEEDDSDGTITLLYRFTENDLSSNDYTGFHSKCDDKGPTVTIIETAEGHILGGYSNAPWKCKGGYSASNKAFLFLLSGGDIESACKMKLQYADAEEAIFHSDIYGPTFGINYDMYVGAGDVYFYPGTTYEKCSSGFTKLIKEMEVFQVTSKASRATTPSKKHGSSGQVRKVQGFSANINDAINAKWSSLAKLQVEVLKLEGCFKDESNFVTLFGGGDAKDIVSLNVTGTIMVTKRGTLCAAPGSVLAQQFDDSKWTEQGCNNLRVKEWMPEDVSAWIHNIDGIPDNVPGIFRKNEITGLELLALSLEGLKMMGIERAGTLCLLLKEITALEKASQDVVTLVEHSPYCFGKILDHLRLKKLHHDGLVGEPALPVICDAQMGRFGKVVKYFFPGDGAKDILG